MTMLTDAIEDGPICVNPSDILTPDELAARLKTTKGWIAEKTRKRQRNPIPHYKIGRYIRFNWREVSAWLSANAKGYDTRTAD